MNPSYIGARIFALNGFPESSTKYATVLSERLVNSKSTGARYIKLSIKPEDGTRSMDVAYPVNEINNHIKIVSHAPREVVASLKAKYGVDDNIGLSENFLKLLDL